MFKVKSISCIKFTLLFAGIIFSLITLPSLAQNPKIRCYFNHPVNTAISSGTDAVYLNGSFDDTLAAYINRAKYSIDIAQYDYTSNSYGNEQIIAMAANDAVLRGVTVRWIYNGTSSNSGLAYLSPAIKTLSSPTSNDYGIMHHKFMVIDANSADSNDAMVMTGSYDWSTQQTSNDYNNILFIQDKNIALAYYREFNQMWGGTGAAPDPANERFGPYKTPSSQNIFNVNGTVVELYFSPQDYVGSKLQNVINSASSDIIFGIYTFTDNTIANLIKTKYNSGVAVKGIMDSYSLSYAAYRTLSPVLGTNLKIYSISYIYHNKVLVADASNPLSDPQVFTGSFNWSISAQTLNDENAIIIHDASIANQYQQSICQDFENLGGASCTPVIPSLQWVSFTASLQHDDDMLLNWSIANGSNVKYFSVEQSSDNFIFDSIGVVNKTGNADTQAFEYIDPNPIRTTIGYYRLKAISYDGRTSYSSVIAVKGKPDELSIYPNPVTNSIFTIATDQEGIKLLEVFDDNGRLVKQLQFNNFITDISMHGLAKGVYELMIFNSNGTVQSKRLMLIK